MRLAAYALFVLVAAVAFAWLSSTPLMDPIALVVGPLILLRAVMPLRWIPWLRNRTEAQR